MGRVAVRRLRAESPVAAPAPAAAAGHRAIAVVVAALALVLPLVASIVGCQSHQPQTAALPATQPSLATTQPTYWFEQPGVYAVESDNFDRLFAACEDAARHFHFVPDRLDPRRGIVTTVPMTGKQFFEFWRNDIATADDEADASLANYRRTLQFQVQRLATGGYRATPRVVIERYVQTERPITAQVYLREAFRSQRKQHPVGTPESDRRILIPHSYWYATGRDVALEKKVAEELAKVLKQP